MSRGRKRFGSSAAIQLLSTVLLPEPGGPVKSITPRRAAVVSMKVRASLWEALAKIPRDFSSAAKGARRNPHARRRSSSEAGVLAWREGSALIVVPPVVDLAIEVEIGLTSHSLGGGLMPNFHAIHEDGIEAQFDLEGAQGEVHLEDF